ncbi:MAG: peptidylprolyl isomerase [Bacteroidota bacterium]
MAIISKIREHSGVAVGVVAVSLLLFLVGGDLLSNNSILNSGSRDPEVGEINGEGIKNSVYQSEIKELESEYALNQNKAPDAQTSQGFAEQAWSMLVFKNGYKDEMDKLGLTITPEEKEDMLSGENIHPVVKSSFTDPKTGEFNKQNVKSFRSQIAEAAKTNEQAARQYVSWQNFVRKLPDDRLRTKYENMLKMTYYVTKEEAKREYQNLTAKGEVKYLFVPYSAIADSTIKPTDAQLQEYLSAHKGKYQVKNTRTVDYVQWMLSPSSADSAAFRTALAETRTEFASAENDTLFAASKSDNKKVMNTLAINELPAALADQAATLQKGQVYGPVNAGATYNLYKVTDISNEGAFSARASHILFKWTSPAPADKKAALDQANKILKEIKGGKSFEDMARQYGTDGTAPQGGDLGWFSEGRMVKPFEAAVMNAKTKGLLPSPVETDFGYHLIKITETKTNLKYKVVTIENNVPVSSETVDSILVAAQKFKTEATDKATFEEAVKKYKLNKMSTGGLMSNQFSVNDMTDARPIIQWAFNAENTGVVSDVYDNINNRAVVALLTKKSEEGTASVEDVRDALTAEVRKQEKAKQIIAKLKGNTLEEMQTAFGTGAVVNTAPELTQGASSLQDFGYDPGAVGKIFSLKAGATSKPFAAENGVAAVTLVKTVPAPEIADYSQFKTQLMQRRSGNVSNAVNEAIRELSKIKDERIKMQ